MAAGCNQLKIPQDSLVRKFKITLRKSTGNRIKDISNEQVRKAFQSALGKADGWLQIFVLDAAQFQNSESNSLSAIKGEIRTLDELSGSEINSLSNLGLRSGALNLLRSLSSSASRVQTPTPTISPHKTLPPVTMTSTTTPTSSFSDFETFEALLDTHLSDFFLFADQIRKISGQSRAASEKALFELRQACSTAMEKYLAFHKSSRTKRPRSESPSNENRSN